jgi:hypothetical protein
MHGVTMKKTEEFSLLLNTVILKTNFNIIRQFNHKILKSYISLKLFQ